MTLGLLDTKSVLIGAAIGATVVALSTSTPLYYKGLGLEVQLNGARAVATHLAQSMGGGTP